MTTRCISRSLAIVAGAILTFAAIFTLGASTASAQCTNFTIINNTSCTVDIYLICPGFPASPYTLPPNNTFNIALPAGCGTPEIVPIICGNRRTLRPGTCFKNVSVAPNCCADVCYDITTCTVTYTQVQGPCPC